MHACRAAALLSGAQGGKRVFVMPAFEAPRKLPMPQAINLTERAVKGARDSAFFVYLLYLLYWDQRRAST